MPQQYDLEVYRGDTGIWEFTFWQDKYKSKPYDLTGATSWLCEIRQETGSVVKGTMAVTLVAMNRLRLEMSSTTATKLPMEGPLLYDIQGTWPTRVTTMVKGKVLREGDISGSSAT
jgi:hypothetical protein